jgi:hypothetical protein
VVEFWPSLGAAPQVFVRFKKDSTLSRQERNRLCRRFGGENFLVVRLITPSCSISEKNEWASTDHRPMTEDQTRSIAAARLFNLFAGQEHDGIRPVVRVKARHVAEAACAESRLLLLKLRTALESFTSQPLEVAGKKFRFFITTAAGIHVQKYLYTSEQPEDVLKWAMSAKDVHKLQNNPIKLALRLALLNSSSIPTCATRNCLVEPDILAEGATTEQASGVPELIMTDGCGRISKSFAEKVREGYNSRVGEGAPRMKMPKAAIYEDEDSTSHLASKSTSFRMMLELPSAFQIRYGGNKGMLVVTPDYQMKGYDIVFSQSMVKFATPHGGQALEHHLLEIMGFSWALTNVTTNTEILDILWQGQYQPACCSKGLSPATATIIPAGT